MRGAWIEMTNLGPEKRDNAGRSPCGERGLKLLDKRHNLSVIPSLPVRGAWIEISTVLPSFLFRVVAPRAGSVD